MNYSDSIRRELTIQTPTYAPRRVESTQRISEEYLAQIALGTSNAQLCASKEFQYIIQYVNKLVISAAVHNMAT